MTHLDPATANIEKGSPLKAFEEVEADLLRSRKWHHKNESISFCATPE